MRGLCWGHERRNLGENRSRYRALFLTRGNDCCRRGWNVLLQKLSLLAPSRKSSKLKEIQWTFFYYPPDPTNSLSYSTKNIIVVSARECFAFRFVLSRVVDHHHTRGTFCSEKTHFCEGLFTTRLKSNNFSVVLAEQNNFVILRPKTNDETRNVVEIFVIFARLFFCLMMKRILFCLFLDFSSAFSGNLK